MKTYQKLITLPQINFPIPHYVIETYVTSENQDQGYMETENDIEELKEFLIIEATDAVATLIDHMNLAGKTFSIELEFEHSNFYNHWKQNYPALMRTLLIWYNG